MLETEVDLGVLPGFVAVILLFLVPPGPDMAFMVAVGLESGRRCALKAILGIGTGMSIYAAFVVVGLGRIAQAHPAILHGIKVLGALYLLWLAFVTIRNARDNAGDSGGMPIGRPYLRGMMVTLANPKVLLFFVAVLPQFMGQAQNAALQLAMLGAVNVLCEIFLYGAIGVLAGVFHSRFAGSRKGGFLLSYVAGTVYVVLAGVVVAETLAV